MEGCSGSLPGSVRDVLESVRDVLEKAQGAGYAAEIQDE